MPTIFDDATRWDQPFDQDPMGTTIDAGVDAIGLTYNPKTGTFSRTGSGGGGGGFAGGGQEPLPSQSIPGMHTAVPGAVTGSQGVSAGIGAGAAAGALTNGGGGGSNPLTGLGGMDWKDILALLMGGASAFTSRGPSQGEQRLDNILGIAEDRIRAQEPMFQYLTAMSKANLPKYARGEP